MADTIILPLANALKDCSCAKSTYWEFWAGEPVLVTEIAEKDRRCPEHGKPRWPKEKNG